MEGWSHWNTYHWKKKWVWYSSTKNVFWCYILIYLLHVKVILLFNAFSQARNCTQNNLTIDCTVLDKRSSGINPIWTSRKYSWCAMRHLRFKFGCLPHSQEIRGGISVWIKSVWSLHVHPVWRVFLCWIVPYCPPVEAVPKQSFKASRSSLKTKNDDQQWRKSMHEWMDE